MRSRVSYLRAEEQVVTLRAELSRTAGIAGALLTLTTAVLAALLATTATRPGVAGVLGWSATGAVTGSVVLLGLALRPGLGGPGWPRLAGLTPDGVRAELTVRTDRYAEIRTLSRLALRKFRMIRAAVDLLLAGVGLAVIATAVSALVGAR